MRALVWVFESGFPRDRLARIHDDLAARGVAATVRAGAKGPLLVVEDPPAVLARPEGVVRESRVEVPEGASRREFLDAFAGAVALATVGCSALVAALFSSPPPPRPEGVDEVEAATLAELEAKGSKTFRFGREPCVVVRSGREIFAVSIVCTHLGCLVEWDAARRQLRCPCHRAAFDLEGNVLEGPPPRPLPTFVVSVQGDRVLVRRRGST